MKIELQGIRLRLTKSRPIVGLRLQGPSAPALDLVGAAGDVPEEPADVLLDLGRLEAGDVVALKSL